VEYADWHFNVRPSNTEPLLRLNWEATTPGAWLPGATRSSPSSGPDFCYSLKVVPAAAWAPATTS